MGLALYKVCCFLQNIQGLALYKVCCFLQNIQRYGILVGGRADSQGSAFLILAMNQEDLRSCFCTKEKNPVYWPFVADLRKGRPSSGGRGQRGPCCSMTQGDCRVHSGVTRGALEADSKAGNI